MRCFYKWTALLAAVLLEQAAVAQSAPLPASLQGKPVSHRLLTVKSDYSSEATVATVLREQRHHVLKCYGASTTPTVWDEALSLGDTFRAARAALAAVSQAKKKADDAAAEQKQLEGLLAVAKQRVDDETIAEKEWAKQTDAASAPMRIAAGQALARAKTAREDAERQLLEARDKANAATSTYEQEAIKAGGVTPDSVEAARHAFAAKLHKVQDDSRSPAEFRWAARDETRRNACTALGTAMDAAFQNAGTSVESSAQVEREKTEVRISARVDDTLAKTTGVASAVTGSSSALEMPGAPERLVYSVMSALGADAKTTGTQLLMTLNLASLANADATRPVKNTLLRNLFLRAALPLEQTAEEVAAAAVAEAAPSGSSRVSRMSFVLGGSLVDDSDPRSVTYDACFDMARVYAPFALDESTSAARVKERQLYYDTCTKIAANSDKLAWRAGLGVITLADGQREKTKPELMALAVVYSPFDWVYFNLIGQRLLEPTVVNVFGGGLSLYADAGGDAPGSQWGRISLNALILAQHRERDRAAGIEKSTGWEARLSLSGTGKVVTGGVAQFSIGPRIISSGDVSLLATIALTYDADRLITTLLTPPAAP